MDAGNNSAPNLPTTDFDGNPRVVDGNGDGIAVVQVGGVPNVIGISLSLPAKTLKEFIAYARARPGELNYASVGVGSISHLSAEILNNAAGLKTVHVPFKLLADGWSEGEIISNYPGIAHEDILACLAYARDVLSSGKVFPSAA